MRHTLIAMFDQRADAERARDRLATLGFDRSAIDLRMQDDWNSTGSASTSDATAYDRDAGGGIGGWFRSLFGIGDDDDDVRTHHEALRRGGTMLTVEAPDEARADAAAEVLHECGAIDLDERATQWRAEGWGTGVGSAAAGGMAGALDVGTTAGGTGARASGTKATSSATGTVAGAADTVGKQAIPIVEEELAIGKRAVRRGAVRVYTRVVETPVEEQVRLREEHAEVVRRDVDRPATEADLRAMKDGSIELTESAEEAVVSKQARVTGEVEVGKRVTERTETVRDTVRRTEVQVDEDAHATARRDGSIGRDETPTGRREG